MRKTVFRACLLLLPLTVFLCLAIPQNAGVSYPQLVKQYKAAQHYYNKATGLNSLENYGPKEEALEKEWNEKALKEFTSLYQQTPSAISSYDSLRFYVCFKIGELQHYFENFSEAVLYYREAIAVKEKSGLPDSLLFKPYLYAGLIFYNQNKFDTAVQFFKKAEAVQAKYGNGLAEAERLYNILGVLYYDRGNYKQAQNYFQKALTLLPSSHPFYNDLFVNYKINLAQLHLRLEEYEKANDIYQELLPKKINLNEINHNIGSLNLSLGAAGKAIQYFRKVNYQNNKTVRLYNSIGEAFFNLKNYDSANHYYQKALAAYAALGQNGDKIGYGLVLKNLGDFRLRQGKNNEALPYYQQAIHLFYPSFANNSIYINPKEFSGVFSYINLFNVLTAKADAWHAIYIATRDIKAAQEELKAYQSAFELIVYVERTYDSDEARLFLTRIKHAVYNKPIDIAFELYTKTTDIAYLNQLYYFDQLNKATVLSLNRQLNSGLEGGSLHPQKEQQIKEEITRLSIRAAQVNDSIQLASLHVRIRDHEIELSKLQEKPSQKGKGSMPSPSVLQKELLDDKTMLVSYHLADDKLTVLTITKTAIACYQQALPDQFYKHIQETILLMKSPSDRIETPPLPDLYPLFLSHVPVQQLRQLIIIPDDVLAYFPFESLRSEGKYLIEQVAVQYQFSTALLEKNTTDFSKAKTLAFAPFAQQGQNDSLPQLPASGQEIAKTMGQQFSGANATKEKFLQNSNKYSIIHLATHAVANSGMDGLSYIAFTPSDKASDYLLFTQEIYNLRLTKPGLVILSACETGAGQLVKGEGVLSLSRAFSYAGCPNIITSLWKADDFSTAYLTARIHQYLQDGYAVSMAVQKAKIDYLNDQSINPRLKQPYYWSHLVFIGNYQPSESFAWVWLAVGAAILSVAVFLLLKSLARQGTV
ncbi:MAG TPA: CHAT domain-containing tetratricopeptide repeat protein [Flavisolibacter sp.]